MLYDLLVLAKCTEYVKVVKWARALLSEVLTS